MLFSSLTFLFIFLPIVIFLYFIIKKRKYRNAILFVFSILFYAWGEPKYIFLMLFSIIFNYIFTIIMDKFQNNKKKLAKTMLIFIILINLGMLFVFKYADFFLKNINSFFETDFQLLQILLPIGISFYTFQILSYVIDVYCGRVKVQKSILDLGTYVALFPQLIAGPIVRYETVEQELKERYESLDSIADGFRRFIIGFAKKVIIANNMAIIADIVFQSDPTTLGTATVWVGAIAYTFQIYFDFSGYSDMAIGLGKIFGFHFLENFNYPYMSKSITDFWRRWHISLSTWFRDYVYIPLGGSRVKKWKWFRNIIIVWCLTGMWHGASWNFIMWGLYYAVLLIIEKLFLYKWLDKMPSFIGWAYAFLFTVIGWVIFRVESVSTLFIFIQKMFDFSNSNLSLFILNNHDILYATPYFVIAIVASFPFVGNYFKTIMDNSKMFHRYLFDIFLIIIFMFSVILLICGSYNPFIYFRF